MNVKFISKDHEKRTEEINKILPKETIIATTLEPAIEKRLFDIIAMCVEKELAIYRQYPKRKNISADKETPKEMIETFDPRNNDTCFMGKGFRSNGDITDSELNDYRKAIGTIHHPIWGDCTLLEIWGGDHFEEHNEMVISAFKYGIGMIDTCPEIKVHVNPLFQNKKSKDFKLSAAQQEYRDEMDNLLARAMVFGVKSPEEARKARRR